MSKWRFTSRTAAFVALLALATTATAQSENRDLIDGLHSQLLSIAIPLTLFVLVLLVFTAVRFHDTGDPQPTTESQRLEITWIALTVLVLLFVAIAAHSVLASSYISPPQPEISTDADEESIEAVDELPETDDSEVVVRGYQWGWEVTYPAENVTTQDEIVIPADEDVTIWVTADNVVHSLFVGELGLKQDAFPGEFTRVRTIVYETGQYDAVCAEFCGSGHSRMDATVTVVDRETYDEWLDEHEDERNVAPPRP